MMKLIYDGKVVGEITTDKIISLEEACKKLEIDLNTKDKNEVGYDRDLFIMEYAINY